MKLSPAILIIYLFLLACNNTKRDCEFQYTDAGRITHRVQGCLVDSLEEGLWTVYDTANRLIEKGDYRQGIRTGVWQYPLQPSTSNSIGWSKYVNPTLRFATNIPDVFSTPHETDYYVQWKHSDTSKKLRLTVAFHDLSNGPINLDSFYLQGMTELESNQLKATHSQDKLFASNKTYYFNLYNVHSQQGAFEILNCYSGVNGRLVDISVRFDDVDAPLARNIYASVLSNIFIDSTRFIYPFAQITKSK